jgi:hypothetical protein
VPVPWAQAKQWAQSLPRLPSSPVPDFLPSSGERICASLYSILPNTEGSGMGMRIPNEAILIGVSDSVHVNTRIVNTEGTLPI